jgi:hypothetical protein
MALPTWPQGALRPSIALAWYEDEESETPMDLTGITSLTGVIYNIYTDEARAIVGDLTVTDADSGAFRWDLSAEDVAEYGRFKVQFTAEFGTGQTPAKTFSAEWRIDRALVVS